MLILSEKWITTKCQPPDLRAWVADLAAVAPLGPDNPRGHRGQTDLEFFVNETRAALGSDRVSS